MKRFLDVHTEEIMAGKEETVLHSDANRACLVICAYDSMKKIGGLAHAMFLSGRHERKMNSSIILDADHAIDEMLKDMELLGAERDNIEVKLVTGENVTHEENDPVYNEALTGAFDILKRKHVRCQESTLSDVGDKHVTFDVGSGAISYE
ncbi:MAG: hypothetical protein P9X22_03345 [Candidatus Zapsychrus exili]|nr:hypothetical protein [Candidatus Zapsychrus exili]